MRIGLSMAPLGAIFLLMATMTPQPASAARLTDVLRAVLLPEEARQHEEMARRRHRPDEERYWRDYGAGLEEQRRERGIGAEEARRYEERAQHSRQREQERYWRDYRAVLGGARR